METNLPPLPPGFTLDPPIPPLPPGFTLDPPVSNLKAQNPGEYDPASPEYQAKYGPTSGMSGWEKGLAGAGKAFVDLGRGAGQLVGAVSKEDVARSREQDAPLMASTEAKIGNLAGNVAAAMPAAFVPGANTVAGAGVIGAGLGLLQPAESNQERFNNTALGGMLGAGGQKVGQTVGKYVGGKIASRTAAAAEDKASNAVRDATIRESQKVGYVLPPATINQSSKGAIAAESLSGKAATAQTAAFRNQKVTNRLIREDLGLKGAGQTGITDLKTIRQRAGLVYDQIGKTGRIKADQQYLDDIANLSAIPSDVAQEFPGASAPSADKIRELADSLYQQDFDSGAAMKYVRLLREEAKQGFKSVASKGGDVDGLAIARAKQEAAGALEDMTMRHLRSVGKSDLADTFSKARTTIAKSHDAEVALNPGTGNFEATKLGAKLRRGKPMGGNFEIVAKFASAFPSSAKELTTGPGVSALSAVLSGSAGAAGLVSGNPAFMAAAALPLARGGARAAILSKAGQAKFFPNYAPKNALLDLTKGASVFTAPVAIGFGNSK